MQHFRVAAIQATPSYLQREATIEAAAAHVRVAGAGGCDLVVFPESFVPGYPDWVWRRKPWNDDEWYRRFALQAVQVDGPALDPIRDAACEHSTWVALGITERSSSGTLYNAVVYVDDKGAIAGLHRKLVPTGAERLVWANGQGPTLTVVDVGGVRVGSLICWENYMPLARAALYRKGIDVLLAPTWDNSDQWLSTLTHTAKEGQVFVIGVSAYLRGCDVPRDLPGVDDLYGGVEDVMSGGNTTILAPGGEILEGPLLHEVGVVRASLDLGRITAGRRMLDPTGHYARPDILELTVH